MREFGVGATALVVVVLFGTLGTGLAAADGNEAFAVVPEGLYVEAPVDDPGLEARLTGELGVEERAVRVDSDADTVEVLSGDVTAAEFVAALDAAGIRVDEAAVRDRPTDETMTDIEAILQRRYAETPVEATVEVRGGHLLVDPSKHGERARELATTEGVRMLATVPDGDGHGTVPVLTSRDFRNVGAASQSAGSAYVPVTLTQDAGESFQAAMREHGYAREGGTVCEYDLDRSRQGNLRELGPEQRCLLTVTGDEVVYASSVAPGLADAFRDGSFGRNPTFRIVAADLETARELELYIRTGSLPTAVTIQSPENVSWDAGDRIDAATADGPGFGPLPAVVGLLGVLGVGRIRRR